MLQILIYLKGTNSPNEFLILTRHLDIKCIKCLVLINLEPLEKNLLSNFFQASFFGPLNLLDRIFSQDDLKNFVFPFSLVYWTLFCKQIMILYIFCLKFCTIPKFCTSSLHASLTFEVFELLNWFDKLYNICRQLVPWFFLMTMIIDCNNFSKHI